MTNRSTTYGAEFSDQVQADGILGWLNGGGFTPLQTERLTDALMLALREEVDERLPNDATWQPGTSEFLYEAGDELPDFAEMRDLFVQAWAAVEARYEQIELHTWAQLAAERG